jgi:hypothetical protein
MHDDGELTGNCDAGLLHADPLGELDSRPAGRHASAGAAASSALDNANTALALGEGQSVAIPVTVLASSTRS